MDHRQILRALAAIRSDASKGPGDEGTRLRRAVRSLEALGSVLAADSPQPTGLDLAEKLGAIKAADRKHPKSK